MTLISSYADYSQLILLELLIVLSNFYVNLFNSVFKFLTTPPVCINDVVTCPQFIYKISLY